MTKWSILGLAMVVALSGCAGDGAATVTTSPSTTSSSFSTTTTTAPAVAPDHYRFGEHGLSVVVDVTETLLVSDPVVEVRDDLMGGVLFRYDWSLERYGTHWLPAGATEPTTLEPGVDFWFTSSVGGRPTLFFPALQFDEACLVGHDLVSGIERTFYCAYEVAGQDGGLSPGSFGGDLFVGVSWMAVGGQGTSLGIGFRDRAGQAVEPDTNPLPGNRVPSTINATISPDGRLLAYLHWPAAFWDVEVAEKDYDRAFAAWEEATAAIPARVVVVDLGTGAEVWQLEAPSGVRLTDFDGRYLVLADDADSTIHDSASDGGPWPVAGRVALVRPATSVVAVTSPATGWG